MYIRSQPKTFVMLKQAIFLLSTLLSATPLLSQQTIKGIPKPQEQKETVPQATLTTKGVETAPTTEEELPPLWTRELAVRDGSESFEGYVLHAYTITIHEIRKDNLIGSIWKDRLKDRGSKVTVKKGIARAEKVSLPEITHEYLDVVAKFDENKGAETVNMTVSFLKDGKAINPEDDPEAHEKAMQMMYNLSVDLNRAVVNEQIEDQEKIRRDLEKDLDRLRKENENLYKTIDKNERNLAKAESDQQQAEQELETSRESVTAIEARVAYDADENQLKELSKVRKEIEKLERNISKLIDDQVKYKQEITEARNAIPENEKLQEWKQQEIENQQGVIARYRKKLAAVN